MKGKLTLQQRLILPIILLGLVTLLSNILAVFSINNVNGSARRIVESIKIIQGKLKHNKKRFPIPGAFLQHVFGDLIPLIC